MSSVDDRIVNMQFNNKQFVGGAQESEKALQSLETQLGKTAQSKGLEGLGNSVEAVKTKFSAMQVAGVAAVATIASKATAAGLNLLKSLTIEPLMDGFREYQTGLNSVQTIMSNTGKNVQTVNKALDQLNHYADQTIYNFSEMARNVGTFTAAGVDLDTSVKAIKGIANLAAASGSSAQQASTAMYQLSQAIAAGRVGLQDWNSVVNAGMGGKLFQTALARTAIAMDTLKESSVKLVGPMQQLKINGDSFRNSISASSGAPSWLTSDVLVNTLDLIATGYTKAQLAAKGYSEQQIKDIQKLQRQAFDAATKIKTLPQLVGVIRESIGSTFSSIFRTVLGDFKQSKKLWSDVGYAIIGPQGFLTKAQDALSGAFETWAKSGKDGFNGRERTFDAIGKIIENVGTVLLRVKRAFNDVFPPSATNILMSITIGLEKLADFLTIKPNVGIFKDLRAIFAGFFSVLHIGLTVMSAVKEGFMSFFDTVFSSSGSGRSGIISMIADVARLITNFDKFLNETVNIERVMSGLGQVLGAFVQPLVIGISLAIKAISVLTSGKEIEKFDRRIRKAKEGFNQFSDNLHDGFEKIFGSLEKFDGLGAKLADVFDFVPDMSGIGDAIVNGITEGLSSEALQNLRNAIVKISNGIVTWFKETLGIHSPAEETKPIGENIVAGILEGILKAAGILLNGIGDLAKAVVGGIISAFGQFDPLQMASILNALFTGALILAIRGFFKNLGQFMNSNVRGAITETFQQLTSTLQTMQKVLRVSILLQIAAAVVLLAGAIVALSLIPAEDLAKGLGAVAALMGALLLTFKLMDKMDPKKDIAIASTAMLAMATSVSILAGALALLALIPMEALGKGIGAIAALLGLMTGLMVVMGKSIKSAEVGASAMIAMAFAIDLLAGALAVLALIPAEALAKGVGAVAQMLGLMTALMYALSPLAKTAPLIATGMIAMGLAIDLIAGALVVLAAIPANALSKAMKAMALTLLSLTLAMVAMSGTGPMALAGAAGMVAIAAALTMLIPLLVILGSLSGETLAKGIGALAVVLLLLVAAVAAIGVVAEAVAPGLLAFGYAVALVGAGMLAFGTGFAIMAAAGVAGVAVLTAAFEAFIALLPSIGIQLAAMFVAFLQTIAEMMPKIRAAAHKIIDGLLGILQDAIPEVGDLFQAMIDRGIQVLEDTIPQLIELGFTIIDSFLQSLADHTPNIVDNAVEIMTTFMDEIGNHTTELANAAGQMIVDILNGLTDAIDTYAPQIRDAGLKLAGHLIDGMTGGLAGKATGLIGDIAGGIGGGISKLLGRGVASNEMEQSGRDLVSNLVRGVQAQAKETAAEAVASVVALADKIIAGIDDTALALQNKASAAQQRADNILARAQANAKAAEKLRKENPKSKLAKELKKLSEEQQKAAEKAQAQADRKAQKVADQQQFFQADTEGKADIRSQEATDLASRAQEALADANAKAKLAKKLQETNRKLAAEMLEESKKAAAQAKKLAAEARKKDQEAQDLYDQAVKERIKDFEQQQILETGSNADKIKVLEDIASAQQAKAEAARKQAQTLLEMAKQAAKTDDRKASLYLDQAQAQADAAQQAADAAQQALNQAKQIATGGGGGTGVSNVTPSKSILEDAASSVDRYTASLALAQELAAAAPTVLQFEQNNYSPEALSNAEIYRQSKNLLSTAEIKMTELTSG